MRVPEVTHEGRLELTWTNKKQRLLALPDGRYRWTAPGDYRTSEVRLLHDVTTVGDTKPTKKRAQDNLLIRGDALHALTSLIEIPEYAAEYVGKVKLVYIDPPFNTGQLFNHYDDALEHSVWLTMLRDRLIQIRSLLAEDGSVWLHLDDREMHRARSVLDEIFGSQNFVSTVVWQKVYAPKNNTNDFSVDQDYILVYSKNPGWVGNRLPRTAAMAARYKSIDGDAVPWKPDNLSSPGARTHQGMVYAIQSPFTGNLYYPPVGRFWGLERRALKSYLEAWGAEYEDRDLGDSAARAKICGLKGGDVRAGVQAIVLKTPTDEARDAAESRLAEGTWPVVWFGGQGQTGPQKKQMEREASRGRAPQTWWTYQEVGHSQEAKREIQALFPDVLPFDTPKPEKLMARIIHLGSEPGDIVLDCFAGSGTTAAVAHKMSRRWVTVEWARSTIENFTMPRLSRVVDGTDLGGVSSEIERVATHDLPDGVSAVQAQEASRVLTAAIKFGAFEAFEEGERKKMTAAIKESLKTQLVKTGLWAGGGGFRVMDVAPSMFQEEDGDVYLSEWATGEDLSELVAAQYRFEYESQPPFAGQRGSVRLAVIDGYVNQEFVDYLLSSLSSGELLEVYATGIDPDAQAHLKEQLPGSNLVKIPAAIISSYRRAMRRERGLNWIGAGSDD